MLCDLAIRYDLCLNHVTGIKHIKKHIFLTVILDTQWFDGHVIYVFYNALPADHYLWIVCLKNNQYLAIFFLIVMWAYDGVRREEARALSWRNCEILDYFSTKMFLMESENLLGLVYYFLLILALIYLSKKSLLFSWVVSWSVLGFIG